MKTEDLKKNQDYKYGFTTDNIKLKALMKLLSLFLILRAKWMLDWKQSLQQIKS